MGISQQSEAQDYLDGVKSSPGHFSKENKVNIII